MKVSYWAKIGQIATALAGVATVYLAFTQFRQPSAALVYTASLNAYAESPDAPISLHEAGRILTRDRTMRILAGAGVDTSRVSALGATSEILGILRDSLSPGTRIASLLVGTVENKGTRLATDVVLSVPGAQFAEIQRDSGGGVLRVKGAIPLGSIRGHEKVDVTVWDGSPPAHYWVQDITLSHTAGLGTISLAKPVSGIPLWLFENGTSVVLIVVFVSILMIIIFGAIKSATEAQPNKPGSSELGSVDEATERAVADEVNSGEPS